MLSASFLNPVISSFNMVGWFVGWPNDGNSMKHKKMGWDAHDGDDNKRFIANWRLSWP